MEHQDWNPLVISRRPDAAKKAANESYVKASKTSHAAAVAKKLDKDTESTGSPERASHSLRMAIQKARLAKNLTQEKLAQSLFIKKEVIQSYESGEAIPQPHMIQQLQRILQCKLPKA